MKKILGISLIASPFIGLIFLLKEDWKVVLFSFGVAVGVAFLVGLGTYLLS